MKFKVGDRVKVYGSSVGHAFDCNYEDHNGTIVMMDPSDGSCTVRVDGAECSGDFMPGQLRKLVKKKADAIWIPQNQIDELDRNRMGHLSTYKMGVSRSKVTQDDVKYVRAKDQSCK